MRTYLFICVTFFTLILITSTAKAQLYPLGSLYYQNEYIGNPAMAGIEEGLKLNGIIRKQWTNIPGSPLNQSLTATYHHKERVGLGINFFNESAGLLKRTRLTASYAYHLPLGNEDQKLHMGLSLGMMYDRVATDMINGDPNDMNIGRFNQRDTYIDGDFGMAYTSGRLTVQASLPNLKQVTKRDEFHTVNYSTFFTAISYSLVLGEGFNSTTLTPKVLYRGVKGLDNQFDIGANLSFINNRLSLTGLYHSTENASFGLGINFNELSLLTMYTTATGALKGYTHENFEMGIGYNFKKKNK